MKKERQKKVKDPNAISIKELLLWNSRQVSSSMNIVIMGFISIFCSDILGLSIGLVGALLLVSKIFDGITDIIVGYIVDRTNTKLGRGRPYELCIIGYWACTVLLFACPAGWEIPVKCAWILIMYAFINSIFGTFLGSAQLPYSIRAFNNQRKYIVYGSYGGLLSMIGAIIVNISFPIMMARLGTSSGGWVSMLLIFAVPGIFIGLLRFIFIPEKYNVDAETDKINLKDVWNVLKTNKYIYLIAIMVFIYNLVANMGVTVYYYTYVVGKIELMSVASMVSMLMVPSMIIAPIILKKITVSKMCYYGFLACCIGSIINWFAYDNFTILMVAAVFTGLGVLPVNMFSTLMIIDCADYNEWLGKPRMEGTLSVIPGLGTKLGSALGAFILGLFLSISGYISTTADTAVIQPDSAILMIRLLMSFIPLILYVIAIIAVKMYKLDGKMPQIRKDLEARRAKRNEVTANEM